MTAIRIRITRYIHDDQPGFVACTFKDVWGKEHTLQDKVPVVTKEYLDANSEYPKDGVLACEIIKSWIDPAQRTIFTVTTERPWGVDTLDGLTEFDVLGEQLTELT